ncbi:TlpA family protein disulfide reductase [Microbacterium oxydans]|uniref:TlpA family protein disulfide reductase n=1 Tax=Microbacterium oxydans TaxID=82380 RepID=UPI001142A941|nr:TlpA disulfide reductase family protein [Microbacterium oxydans]KAB1888836.1 TlpA family protein disulfide reductase [Microbacterium oxydans]GED40656.1 hypothetical protein MOX01_37980 [Microbacterium oxydans]
MTTTLTRRRISIITVLIVAVALILILAMTALNRGAADGSSGGNSVDRIEVVSVDDEAVTVPAERPTVLYFMASWCYTCIPQAAAMNELEDEYADRAQFIAVDVTPENTKAEVDGFREPAGFPDHPYVVDKTGELTQRYNIVSLDSTVVVAPDGEVLGRADGKPMEIEALRTFLDETLP